MRRLDWEVGVLWRMHFVEGGEERKEIDGRRSRSKSFDLLNLKRDQVSFNVSSAY